MEKWDTARAKRSNWAVKVVYALFTAALVGLIFVPSLFSSSFGGYKFTGGQTLFKAIILLITDIFKKSNKFGTEFAYLAAHKWLIYAVVGMILANLAVLFVVLFTRSEKTTNRLSIVFSAFSLLVFLGLSIFYAIKNGAEYYQLITTPLVCMAAISAVFILIFGLISKNWLKSAIYLLSLIAVAGLFYKSLSANANYASAYSLNYAYILMFKHLPQMITLMTAVVPKFFAVIFVYGIIAAAGLTALNLIISAFSLVCKKICIFDIVRFTLSLVVSAVFFVVAVIKFDVSFIKSFGFLAVLAATLIATILTFIFCLKKGKSCCGCLDKVKKGVETTDGKAIPAFETDFVSAEPTIAAEPLETVSESELVKKQEHQVPKADETEKQDTFDTFAVDEPPVLAEEAAQLEIEKASPKEEPKHEEPRQAEQLDIESLKAEILADLYMKERTRTATEVPKQEPPVIKPRYEIKELPPIVQEQPKKMPYKNPYMQQRQETLPDRFYDSLTETEKSEFTDLFIRKLYGENKRLPDYVIGGDNAEFFSKVFIFIGRFRSVISESLLSKIYLYSVSL